MKSDVRNNQGLRRGGRAGRDAPTDRTETAHPKSSAGEGARSPDQIPPRGWKEILARVWSEFGHDQIPLISAGVTFYIVLAIFPGIAALVSLYGLFADGRSLAQNLGALSHVMPGGAVKVVGDQMQAVIASHKGGLSAAFVLGLAIAIWSASGAVKAVMVGLNVAYEVEERRGLIARTLIALGFTAAFTIFGLLAAAAFSAAPSIRASMGTEPAVLVEGVTWAGLFIVMALALAILYRYGPSRKAVRLRWITWGSALAVIIWLVMSALFTFYVANFGHYNKTYGSLGAAIGFMTWIYLSVMVVLTGAELNSEIERQADATPKAA